MRQWPPKCNDKSPDDDKRDRLLVDPVAFARFQARIDAPAAPNQRLIQTMRRVPPWKD
jgi:uncharacterized protein (DUF1778 family)